MPAEDLYGDPTPAPAANAATQPDAEPKGEDNYKSVLVPKDICSTEMKVGDKFSVTVEQVLEDQYSVKYSPEEEEPAPEEGAAGPAPAAPPNSLYE